jgi:predicted nucleic acid-binding protein
MKKTRIYADTSVIGGCCDPEFQWWSNGLLKDFQSRVFSLFLSVLTDAEIEDAPDDVKSVYAEFRTHATEIIELTAEAVELAEAYLNHNILTPNFRDDARHIAMATVAGVDLIVSWNFKHIVHFEKIQRFNAVNIELGYKPILIYSPREVTTYGLEDS